MLDGRHCARGTFSRETSQQPGRSALLAMTQDRSRGSPNADPTEDTCPKAGAVPTSSYRHPSLQSLESQRIEFHSPETEKLNQLEIFLTRCLEHTDTGSLVFCFLFFIFFLVGKRWGRWWEVWRSEYITSQLTKDQLRARHDLILTLT